MSLIKIDESKLVSVKEKEAIAARVRAYNEEADPLFFKAQRGEVLMTEWKAKVSEIKARYPKE
jgi:RNA processing factor Prp31